MLKSILNLEGVSQITRTQKQMLKGGGTSCREDNTGTILCQEVDDEEDDK